MGIDLIVMDFDGTILKLMTDYKEMREKMHSLFLENGVDVNFRPLYPKIEDAFGKIRNMHGVEKAEELRKSALSLIGEYEVAGLDETKMIPESTDFIKYSHSKGKKLAIFSSNTKICIERGLQKFSLADYFDMIISREDVKELKPSSEGLKRILDNFNTRSEETIMIGDSPHDIESAKKEGVISVGVLTGYFGKDKLNKADYIFSDLSFCKDLIL